MAPASNDLKLLLLSALASAGLCEVCAQRIVPSVEWERFYHESGCSFRSIIETEEGAFILGGVIYDYRDEEPRHDCIVVKISDQGAIEWERTYGGDSFERITSLQQVRDGGYVFAATSASPPSGTKESAHLGGQDAWIVKLDAGGNKQWERSFGGAQDDSAASILQTSEGGLIFAGSSASLPSSNKESPRFGGGDGWIVKTDAEGNKEWEETFGGEQSDSFASLRQAADGGYVLAGWSYSPPSGNKEAAHFGHGDGWLIKLNREGTKEWEQSFGGTENEMFFSADVVVDGGFIAVGRSSSPPSGNKESGHFGGLDYWVVKVDAAGNKEWDRSYGMEAFTEEAHVILQVRDGGYVLGGQSRLIKIDAKGDQEWMGLFFGSFGGEIRDIRQTKEGGYIVTGNSHGAGIPASGCDMSAWAAKLENVVARGGDAVTWQADAGVVLESTDDLKGEWASDESEVLSVGAAEAITLNPSGEQRYYRLRATGTPSAPILSFASLLSWPVDANQVLELASSRDGAWEGFAGDQGMVGDKHYAIVPPSLQEHYFRTRKME